MTTPLPSLLKSAVFNPVSVNSFKTKPGELILYYLMAPLDFLNSFKAKLSWQSNISEQY